MLLIKIPFLSLINDTKKSFGRYGNLEGMYVALMETDTAKR